MRVLYWTEVFEPQIGGIEVLSAHLLAGLGPRGYEFAVVTSHLQPGLPDVSDHNGIPVYRFHFARPLVQRNLREIAVLRHQMLELKQSFDPDLIHLNSCLCEPSMYFHLHTEAQLPLASLMTIHALKAPSFGDNSFLGRLLDSVSWVTAVSAATLNQVVDLAPGIKHRSSVIHNGLHMPLIEPAPLSFDPPRLICVGRMVADKGFDLALDAFSLLLGHFPQARLVIAGDGEARQDLEQQAVGLNIQHAVEFLGWVAPDKVPELLNSATMAIMPSRWREPFGLVALQAAQMARPIVATRVGGLPEVVVHGQTGLLVEKEDSAALAESITLLLENPGVATEMGLAARRRAQDAFSIQRFVDAYDALYKKLARGADAL